MKRNSIIFVVIIAALLIVFGFFKDRIETNIIPGKIKNEEEKIAYKNEVYGISFDYPSIYAIDERDVVGQERDHHTITLLPKDYRAPENGEGPTEISIDIYQNNLDNLTLENWVTSTSDSNFKLSSGTLIPTKIGDQKAVTYEWDGLYRARTTAFIYGDNVYAVTGTYMDPKDRIVKDYEDVLKSIELSQSTSVKLPQTLVENYLKENISNLSTQKEVLGGKFYITQVTITKNGTGSVSYEDGHIALTADFNYTITPEGGVKISDFVVRK